MIVAHGQQLGLPLGELDWGSSAVEVERTFVGAVSDVRSWHGADIQSLDSEFR
jgi:hypothetical protein